MITADWACTIALFWAFFRSTIPTRANWLDVAGYLEPRGMKIALFVCFLSLVISALSQITLEPKPLTGYEGEDVVVRCVHPPGVMNAQFELRVNGTVFNSHHPKYQSVSSTNTSASYTYGPLEQRTEQGITFTCDDGIGSTDEETITIYCRSSRMV